MTEKPTKEVTTPEQTNPYFDPSQGTAGAHPGRVRLATRAALLGLQRDIASNGKLVSSERRRPCVRQVHTGTRSSDFVLGAVDTDVEVAESDETDSTVVFGALE